MQFLFLEKSQFPKMLLVWKNSANANSSKLCFSQKYPCISQIYVRIGTVVKTFFYKLF